MPGVKFTGPLTVGFLDSDTTAAVIDASGTATFPQLNVSEGINASSSAVFVGPVNVGPTAQNRGQVQLVQRVTLTQSNTAGVPATFVLPTGSDIIQFLVDVEDPFGTVAGVTACMIQVSLAAAGSALTSVLISASGRYDMMFVGVLTSVTGGGPSSVGLIQTSMEQFRNITATIETHVSVVNSASAMSQGQAMLTVVYVQNS